MKLLLVENEDSQIKLVNDAVESFNKKSDIKIELDIAKNLDSGLNFLENNVYDSAIIDLRLEQNDSKGQGNEILKKIKEKLRFPVRVVSGHLGDLDTDLREESHLFKCHNRGDEEYDEIFTELVEIFSTGITGLLNNKGLIEQNISKIFWTHISLIIPELVKRKKIVPGWEVEKVLLRYISLHFMEYLELSIDNNFESVSDIEFYIKPPIKDKIFTGDIIKNNEDNSFGIVLTPACDLATDTKRPNPKADFVTVAIIEKKDMILKDRNSGEVKKLMSNSMDFKYHYLPDNILFEGGFINFQHVLSIPLKDIINPKLFSVECLVTYPFRKDIISRFSNYFSRQGQPHFE
ncbi:hypothetical protein BAS09_09660 [Elizabethkingia ursingii]|uniref:hypothetical protein n=1 Tax=Elizabethkingia ursingii TaxID=1756150 RepID=UPI00099A9943|nr:hypothetical protein [Elizabethkingia ursingii]OPC03922.1 hypothetical protein BAS09_09660 [Elizabethkingia ursingii]